MPEPMTANEIFERLKATPRQVQIDGTSYYVVEGDLFLNETELFAYAARRAAEQQVAAGGVSVQREGLVGMTDDAGKLVRWRKGLLLTYCILRSTFASEEQYQVVVRAMRQATSGWEALCGVNFKHLKVLDDGSQASNERCIFKVAGGDSRGKFIAVAFFPNQPETRRSVYIDPTFFAPNLGFEQAGVLRHELGHVLGFRHEHIRSGAPPACPDEPLENTLNLTNYDPKSVMHYFCGQVGSKELAFTEFDRQGARAVYGPPDREVAYFG